MLGERGGVMAKYKVIIELDDNRENCSCCPFCCGSEDICQLQDLGYCETWEEQLRTCPLEKVESEDVL